MSMSLLGLALALGLVFVGIAGLTHGSAGSRLLWLLALVVAAVVGVIFLLGLGGQVVVS